MITYRIPHNLSYQNWNKNEIIITVMYNLNLAVKSGMKMMLEYVLYYQKVCMGKWWCKQGVKSYCSGLAFLHFCFSEVVGVNIVPPWIMSPGHYSLVNNVPPCPAYLVDEKCACAINPDSCRARSPRSCGINLEQHDGWEGAFCAHNGGSRVSHFVDSLGTRTALHKSLEEH